DKPYLPRRTRQLAVDVKLQPRVEADAVGQALARGGDPRADRMADILRPGPPRGPVLLAQRVEGRVVAQRAALATRVRDQASRLRCGAKDLLEGARLDPEDRVVIDDPLLVEPARR